MTLRRRAPPLPLSRFRINRWQRSTAAAIVTVTRTGPGGPLTETGSPSLFQRVFVAALAKKGPCLSATRRTAVVRVRLAIVTAPARVKL